LVREAGSPPLEHGVVGPVGGGHQRARPEQIALRKLYPAAWVHTFEHRSHGASLAHMDDYITVIERFLADEGA